MSHHEHDHSHDHGGDTYFLDQVCMVGLSAAFGAICIALYCFQSDMLRLMLGPQFHPFVLGSGIVLLVLAAVRGAVLWVEVGKKPAHSHDHGHDHAHDHEHSHQHDHDPATCGHDHSHEHGHEHHHHGPECGHAHEHGHSHDHGHAHAHGHSHADHSHADHDHAWAPWRYVVLLLPVALFLLGIPNKGPKVQAAQAIDMSQENARQASVAASWLSVGPPSWSQLAWINGSMYRKRTFVKNETNFGTLEGIAVKEELRKGWEGKTIKIRGQFVPSRGNPNVFSLARFKIQCCAGDATQLNVPIISPEGIPPDIRANDWILVTGEIEFFPDSGTYRTILRVHSKDDVKKTSPDPNPYI